MWGRPVKCWRTAALLSSPPSPQPLLPILLSTLADAERGSKKFVKREVGEVGVGITVTLRDGTLHGRHDLPMHVTQALQTSPQAHKQGSQEDEWRHGYRSGG